MTTDRELLELAAKAAGIPLKPDFKERFDYYMTDRLMWNPLADDGDALRLAVKLWLQIKRHYYEGDYFVDVSWDVMATPKSEPLKHDPYAATRRAIVRAAAEIGRAMK